MRAMMSDKFNVRGCFRRFSGVIGASLFLASLLATGLFWAKSRDPFHREWLSLKTPGGAQFTAIAVMPDCGGPFPVVVWCHGAGGSLDGDGETLRQFASLGMAAVGIEYSKTNQAEFDAQFAAVLEDIGKRHWAAKAQQTRSAERGVRIGNGEHPTSNIQRPTSNEGEPTPDPSKEGNLQRATFNIQPATQLAWVGNSLGAQRQLSFLARHPERQPMALVRLNGGMVDELRESAERGARNGEVRRAEKFDTSPSIPLPGRGGEGGASQPATFNQQLATALRVWLAHGENDEIFPASDARAVAEWLQARGAAVTLDVYPGRGHGFGEDQPLLVRRAAEFCADQLGATMKVPDTVRRSHWYWWLPALLAGVAICSGRFFFNRGSRCEEAPTVPASKWSGLTPETFGAVTRLIAGLALAAALLLTAAHLLLPLCRATPGAVALARQWCVRPESRADFDWLMARPNVERHQLRDWLQHLNLAALQRGQFSGGLSEADWREFELLPEIAEGGGEIAWRRELWEALAPRVRRETEAEAAAQIVARWLALRISISEAAPSASPSVTWQCGLTDAGSFEQLAVAALRSIGVPARLSSAGRCEYMSANVWRERPAPAISPGSGSTESLVPPAR